MAFPSGWPPRVASGVRTLRAYVAGTATANYSDRAYIFASLTGANPFTPLPTVRPGEDVSAPDYGGPHVVPTVPAGTGVRGDDPPAMIWSQAIHILNYGVTKIFFSFDGTNDHGEVPAAVAGVPGEVRMTDRHEAGIAIRGAGNVFAVMAW